MPAHRMRPVRSVCVMRLEKQTHGFAHPLLRNGRVHRKVFARPTALASPLVIGRHELLDVAATSRKCAETRFAFQYDFLQ